MTEEQRFYNQLTVDYKVINSATRKDRLRYYLWLNNYSKWEINMIELSIKFEKHGR